MCKYATNPSVSHFAELKRLRAEGLVLADENETRREAAICLREEPKQPWSLAEGPHFAAWIMDPPGALPAFAGTAFALGCGVVFVVGVSFGVLSRSASLPSGFATDD